MVRCKNILSDPVLTRIVQDSPSDATENPGIEGKRPEDTYAGSPSEEYPDEYDDGWFVGKGKHKGKNPQVRDHEEEDAVKVGCHIPRQPPRLLTRYFLRHQWARDRKSRENDRDRDMDFGPEDYFDGALRGNRERGDEGEDEVAETMLLISLVVMVAGLFYLRNRWVERLRRDEEERRRRQQPPPPGPPGPVADGWVVLR